MRNLICIFILCCLTGLVHAETGLVREYVQTDGSARCVREMTIQKGVNYETSVAPALDGFIFTHWAMTAKGETRDVWGRAHDAVSYRLESDIDFTAHYLPEGQDSDEDGVPDGYEIYWYGNLTQGADSDTDGDGFTFAEELANETNPLMADSDDEGPVQCDDGKLVTYNPSDYKSVVIVTDVDGVQMTSSCEWLRPGTAVETPAQAQTFAYWVRNGVQCRDELGRAVDQIGFTMGLEPEMLVAVQITDASTRQKLYWYGTTDVSMDSDTDGDGRTFAEEIAVGTNPLMAEEDVPGSILYDDGALTSYSYDGPRYDTAFDPNGGLPVPDSRLCRKDARYWKLPIVSRRGYEFLGWFTALSGGIRITDESIVDAPRTLYAHWDREWYAISFDANGGVPAPADLLVQYECCYGALPVVARKGCRFLGWFTAAEGGTQVSENSIVESERKLYAHWDEVRYLISFNANGGTTTPPAVSLQGEFEYGKLPVVARKGYRFVGWFTAADGGTQITEESIVEVACTLYAHWEETGVQ